MAARACEGVLAIEAGGDSAARRAVSLSCESRLLPFSPCIYLLWADRTADEEIEFLAVLTAANLGLDRELRELLAAWLDVLRPPSATELSDLLRQLRRCARNLDLAVERSLTDLCADLAASADVCLTAAELDVLDAICASLGIGDLEIGREILGARRPLLLEDQRAALLEIDALKQFLSAFPEKARGGSSARASRISDAGPFAIPTEPPVGASSEPRGSVDGNEILALIETSAATSPATAIELLVQFLWFGGLLWSSGGVALRRRLPRIAEGSLIGTVALWEVDRVESWQEIETTATFEPRTGHFVLDTPRPHAAKKLFVGLTRRAREVIVFAQLEVRGERLGVHPFLVSLCDENGSHLPGIELRESTDPELFGRGSLCLHEVSVPFERLLGRFGRLESDGHYSSAVADEQSRLLAMLEPLARVHLGAARALLATSKRDLEISVRSANRQGAGGPLGEVELVRMDLPLAQLQLLPLLAEAFALHFALRGIRRAEPVGSEWPRQRRLAAALVAVAMDLSRRTRSALRAASDCGSDGAAEAWLRRRASASAWASLAGNPRELLLDCARHLLSGERAPFGRFDARGFLRSTLGRDPKPVLGPRPRQYESASRRALRDPASLAEWLRLRAEHLLVTLAWRVRRRLEDGLSGFDAFSECEEHALATARASAEVQISDAFLSAKRTAPEALEPVISSLEILYSQGCIERKAVWFLEHGILDPASSAALRRDRRELLVELRVVVEDLVEAFDLPPLDDAPSEGVL